MAGVRDQGAVISHWQVCRTACWPFPPKNPRRRRQICRHFERFAGRARDFYPDFDVVVTRHCDRRLGAKSVYIQETGVMIGYEASPTAQLIQLEALANLKLLP